MVTCGLTACTPGSAPGPTLGIEYGKPLPFTFFIVAEALIMEGISFHILVEQYTTHTTQELKEC